MAKEIGLDPRVIRLIIDSPLKFVREKTSDPAEIRPCRVRYLGVFAPKSKLLRGEKVKKLKSDYGKQL